MRRVTFPSLTLRQRYWAKVDKRGSDECWPWTGGISNSAGYGCIYLGFDADRRVMMGLAHRVGWELAYGSSPGELLVRHRCDNPPCQNPNHWELGTHLDNMRDRDERGRNVIVYGSHHGKSKLTEQKVREIRRRYAAGENQCSIARSFGVTNQNIGCIVRRETWRHVGDAA